MKVRKYNAIVFFAMRLLFEELSNIFRENRIFIIELSGGIEPLAKAIPVHSVVHLC